MRLAAHGPFDVIVDESVAPNERAGVFVDSFFHLRPGGTYLVRAFRAGARQREDVRLPVARMVRRLTEGRPVRAPRQGVSVSAADACSFGDAFDEVSFGRWHLRVTNKTHALAKMREEQVDALFRERPARGEVVARVPAARLRSRSVVRHNLPEDSDWPTVYTAPELALRSYVDAVCAPYQGVFQGNVVLPDSYRHNQKARLVNGPATQEVTRLFARPKAELGDVLDLPGTFFHLDNEHRGHFGHVLTEMVSRLWAFEHARRAYPDLRVLVGQNHGRDLQRFEREIFEAAGIDVPVTVVDRPVRVERLLSATPMLSHPAYVHPGIAAVWAGIGRALEARSTRDDLPTRVFCSRRVPSRMCLNAGEVEGLARDHGFTVMWPEDLPFVDQVAMFRRAEVVAGYGGSALFTACFVDRPLPLVAVTSQAYTPRNEYMIASVLGHPLTWVAGPTEVPEPPPTPSVRLWALPFRLDLEKEGTLLVDTLRELG